MLLNYHEMTMSEPADSPQKRRQFGIICAVMAAALSYAVMTSGVMLPVEPTQGIFPGGNFCYKLTHRDYAASMGLGRRVAKDVLGSAKLTNTPQKEVEKILYHMYLDNPMEIGGRKLRWATGILVADSEKEKIDKLLSLNTPTDDQATPKRYPTDDEMGNLSATQVFGMLPYELADVPSVDALVVQFPHTHGFVSALVMSYKVIPAMRKMVMEKGGAGTNPIIISTCRQEDDMCTLYAPLVQTQDFLLGLPDSSTYKQSLPEDSFLSWDSFKQGARKFLPFAREYIDMLP